MKIAEVNLLFSYFAMKKSRLLLIASLIISTYSFSQNISLKVMSAQGGFDTLGEMTLEWTLGEPFVETVASSNNILTQGFHQSFLSNNSTLAIDPIPENLYKSVVYPNPVNYELNVQLSPSENSIFNISLYEITGRFIKQSSANTKNSNLSINVADLSSGMYILQISSLNGSLIETHKIIKH